MATNVFSDYPILIELTHNDVPIGTYTEDLGTFNVYRYRTVHYLNRTGQTWNVTVADTAGRQHTFTIQPFAEATLSIPTARRMRNIPISFTITFIED